MGDFMHPRNTRRRDWRKICTALLTLLILTPAVSRAADSTSEMTSRLAPLGLEKLMEIEVTTPNRTESTVGATAAAIYVIGQEEIRRSGATAIPELLRRVPGLDVARIDNNKWAVSVRGFNNLFSNKLLVQMDGRTVYNPMFSGVYWDTVDYPLEDIERIEVIRGPGASVWGANAVNGVINIITKSSGETQGGLVTGAAGTAEHGAGTFRFGGKAGSQATYRMYGKGFQRGEQFTTGSSAHDGWWGGSGGGRLDWQPNQRDSISFDAGFLHSAADRMVQRPTTTPPSFTSTAQDTETSNAGHLLSRWNHSLPGDAGWSLLAYWDDFTRHSEAIGLDLRWQTYCLDFQHQFSLGERQKVVWGVGYQLQDVYLGNSESGSRFALTWDDNRIHPQLFSSFLQDQVTLVRELVTLTVGSKFEHNDFTGFELQPTARLLWTPSERQSLWFSVSRAVRTPALNEMELRGTFVPATVRGVAVFPTALPNHHFRAEEELAYEMGYRAQPTERFSLDAALFYNVYHHLASLDTSGIQAGPAPGTAIVLFTRGNGVHGETHGAELALDWKVVDRWRLYGAYTLLEMFLHPAGAAGEGENPQQQVYLQSSLDLPRDVSLDLIGRWVDQLSGFNPTGTSGVSDKIPSYFALDLRLAWRPLPNLELSLVGQNLTRDHHSEFGVSGVFGGKAVEIERSVYAKAAWRFRP